MPLLFGGLAWLQYRWIGEVAQLEVKRHEAAQAASEKDLKLDYQEAINSIDLDLLMDPRQPRMEGCVFYAGYGEQVARFRRTSPFGRLLKSIWVLVGTGPDQKTWRLDEASGAFVEASSSTLEETPGFAKEIDSGIAELKIGGAPALVRAMPIIKIGATDPGAPGPHPERKNSLPFEVQGALLIELNQDLLLKQLLIPSVERHFTDESGKPAFSIYCHKKQIYASGKLEPAASPDLSVVLDNPVAVRLTVGRRDTPDSKAPSTGEIDRRFAAATGYQTFRVELYQHSGTVGKLLRGNRSKDLMASFTILFCLGASLGLIVVATGRLRSLARQERRFVTSVSHELKTPLSVILSASDNLAAGIIEDPAGVKKYGRTIEAEATRLKEMIDRILSYSRLELGSESPASNPIRPEAVLEEVLERREPMASQIGASFVRSSQPSQGTILGNRMDLASILENLIGNALKHGRPMDQEGTPSREWDIRVETKVEQKGSGLWWACSVQDPGHGIPDRERKTIFSPFRRGAHAEAEQVPGSGLGLAIAKKAAAVMGGDLLLEDSHGLGSRFTVILPFQEGDAAEIGPKDEPPDDSPDRG